ncbi:MAG: DUF4923 family protein [Dysgonamonadaceae bacterium]|jgi:hypothetical protein|nr:DUF4923 family protein [Dysgonamonadaceae bacterium]
MKQVKNIILGAFVFFMPLFPAQAQSSARSVFRNILNELSGFMSSSFSAEDLAGNWDYQGAACNLKSSNFLKQMGGNLVNSQVESKLSDYLQKFGIKQGACEFTFNSDKTYSAKLGEVKLSGNYKLNVSTKQITLTHSQREEKINGVIEKSGGNMRLLFNADDLLALMKTVNAVSGSNSTKALAALTDLYDGVQLGFDLKKRNKN